MMTRTKKTTKMKAKKNRQSSESRTKATLAPGNVFEIGDSQSAFVPDADRKWIEANMIAGPSWSLEGRAFSAAGDAACARAHPVA
jgi:hypothetical protein